MWQLSALLEKGSKRPIRQTVRETMTTESEWRQSKGSLDVELSRVKAESKTDLRRIGYLYFWTLTSTFNLQRNSTCVLTSLISKPIPWPLCPTLACTFAVTRNALIESSIDDISFELNLCSGFYLLDYTHTTTLFNSFWESKACREPMDLLNPTNDNVVKTQLGVCKWFGPTIILILHQVLQWRARREEIQSAVTYYHRLIELTRNWFNIFKKSIFWIKRKGSISNRMSSLLGGSYQ